MGTVFLALTEDLQQNKRVRFDFPLEVFFAEEAELLGVMDSRQVGSPSVGGSPFAGAAPGVEGVDGMEVARRMVQAAEGAALAAQAATRANLN